MSSVWVQIRTGHSVGPDLGPNCLQSMQGSRIFFFFGGGGGGGGVQAQWPENSLDNIFFYFIF